MEERCKKEWDNDDGSDGQSKEDSVIRSPSDATGTTTRLHVIIRRRGAHSQSTQRYWWWHDFLIVRTLVQSFAQIFVQSFFSSSSRGGVVTNEIKAVVDGNASPKSERGELGKQHVRQRERE